MTSTPLVLGAMMFGTRIDESTSFALLDRFVDAGGEWIDTADCYSFWASDTGHGGQSEALLGRWLAARPGVRDLVKIATKLGAEPTVVGGWPERRQGLSTPAVRTALAGSLDRLGVDSIDLIWLHQEDRSVPIEQTVDAIAEFVAMGTVDRVGASNHPAWRSSAPAGTPSTAEPAPWMRSNSVPPICDRDPAHCRPATFIDSGCSMTNMSTLRRRTTSSCGPTHRC